MTKLTLQEKVERLELFETGMGTVAMKHERITFAYVVTGEGRGKIAWAICAKDEPKFSRKRGELLAMQRLEETGGMPFEFDDYDEDPALWAHRFAIAICR